MVPKIKIQGHNRLKMEHYALMVRAIERWGAVYPCKKFGSIFDLRSFSEFSFYPRRLYFHFEIMQGGYHCVHSEE
jgi:hypothetical protein